MGNRYMKRGSTLLNSGKCRSKPQWVITSYLKWKTKRRGPLHHQWGCEKTNTPSTGEDVESGTLAPSVECKLVQLLQRTEQRFLKKIKNRNYHVIQHPTSEYLSKRNEITILKRRDICTLMFTAALFIITQPLETTQTSIGEWMNKENNTYTHVYVYI